MASKINFSEKQNVSPEPVDQTFHHKFDQRTEIMLLIEPETGLILESNAAAEMFYGVSQSKLCGMSIDEINGQSPGQLALKFQKAKDEGKYYIIFPQHLPSGEARTVEILSSPFVWQQKQTLFLIIHDITERTQISDALNHTNMVLQEEALQRDLALEDLHVYQIELEMQNGELRKAQAELEAAWARYFDLYDLAPVGYCTISEKGLILEANLTAANLLGDTRAGLLKKPFSMFFGKEHQDIYYLRRTNLFRTGTAQVFDAEMVKKNGSGTFWGHLDASLARDPNGVAVAKVVISDISERILAEIALVEAKWQLERIIEATRAGTWAWNIQTGETTFNEEWAQLVGYSLAELLPTSIETVEKLTQPDDLILCYKMLDQHFAGDLPYYDFEMRMKHKDGHWVWIHDRGRVINRTEDGKPLMMFGTHTDITARKASDEKIQLLNAELEKLVVTDTLTQINNRRYFMMRCAEEFKRETRNSQPLVLLMMDIDHFKKINDAYGHAVGDLVLQQVAAVLKSNLREIDILGRIGGEEFAMLLPATLLEEAVQLAERLRQSVEEMVFETPGNLPIKVTFSIGAAVFEDTMTNIGNLLRNADEAMYQAKHSGRNCVKVYQGVPPPPRKGFCVIGAGRDVRTIDKLSPLDGFTRPSNMAGFIFSKRTLRNVGCDSYAV